MTEADIDARFSELLDDIEQRSAIAEGVIDKAYYRLYIATLWANIVLSPGDAGLAEEDLPTLHEYLNARITQVLGNSGSVTECFRFVNSKPGELAMNEASLGKTHRDLLLYFSSMILDPEGHRRWMEEIQHPENRTR